MGGLREDGWMTEQMIDAWLTEWADRLMNRVMEGRRLDLYIHTSIRPTICLSIHSFV